jgi:hypothetical protein
MQGEDQEKISPQRTRGIAKIAMIAKNAKN